MGELAAFLVLHPMLRRLPAGDGHGVVVLPGFLADDGHTRPLRSLLCRLGYAAVGWELGRNTRIDDERIGQIGDCIARTCDRTGGKVSLVGWSLGGVLAREISRHRPELVRQVISMGSPLSNDPNHYSVTSLFRYRNNHPEMREYFARFPAVATPPPVPSTSIYSRHDGVVAWRASLQEPGPQAENVEVYASHCGITVNALAAMVVADRLAQREGAWTPFRRHGWRALLYPQPIASSTAGDLFDDLLDELDEPVLDREPSPPRTACETPARTDAPRDRETPADSAAVRLRSRR